MTIRDWLEAGGWGEYAEAFEREAVTLDTLQWLSEDDLKLLGVSRLGHRKEILAAIARNRSTGAVAPGSGSFQDEPGWLPGGLAWMALAAAFAVGLVVSLFAPMRLDELDAVLFWESLATILIARFGMKFAETRLLASGRDRLGVGQWRDFDLGYLMLPLGTLLGVCLPQGVAAFLLAAFFSFVCWGLLMVHSVALAGVGKRRNVGGLYVLIMLGSILLPFAAWFGISAAQDALRSKGFGLRQIIEALEDLKVAVVVSSVAFGACWFMFARAASEANAAPLDERRRPAAGRAAFWLFLVRAIVVLLSLWSLFRVVDMDLKRVVPIAAVAVLEAFFAAYDAWRNRGLLLGRGDRRETATGPSWLGAVLTRVIAFGRVVVPCLVLAASGSQSDAAAVNLIGAMILLASLLLLVPEVRQGAHMSRSWRLFPPATLGVLGAVMARFDAERCSNLIFLLAAAIVHDICFVVAAATEAQSVRPEQGPSPESGLAQPSSGRALVPVYAWALATTIAWSPLVPTNFLFLLAWTVALGASVMGHLWRRRHARLLEEPPDRPRAERDVPAEPLAPDAFMTAARAPFEPGWAWTRSSGRWDWSWLFVGAWLGACGGFALAAKGRAGGITCVVARAALEDRLRVDGLSAERGVPAGPHYVEFGNQAERRAGIVNLRGDSWFARQPSQVIEIQRDLSPMALRAAAQVVAP